MSAASSRRRGPRVGVAAGLVAVALTISGCQVTEHGLGGVGAAAGTAAAAPAVPSPTATPAQVTLVPANRSTNVKPDAAVTATASVGTIKSATLVDSQGSKVPGTVGASGEWKASSRLRPGAAYTMTVTATSPEGTPATFVSKFSTLKPKVTATYSLIADGATVGVGMPIIVQFDSIVTTTAQRAAVERSVKLTSSPAQPGAWGWLDGRQLMYRPKTYWRPGTRIALNANLVGLQTGDGKWVGNSAKGTWNVGSAMISTVDMRTHQMTVTRNGRVLHTFPVSTGRPGPTTETRYGTKVIISRESAITMDSTTIGIPKGKPGYYKIDTKWNMRLTWTGEFVHSAPWSTGAQGVANVSHGCTNMAPSSAQWMYENSKVGDVVKFTGSTRPFLPTEGYGIWTYSWSGWKAQSALAA